MPYIDSEALKKKIFPYGMADNGNYGINAKSVMVAIENAPAVDAVEVVRCKDCERLKNDTFYCKRYNAGYCEFDNMIKPKNHFCSYGERRRKREEKKRGTDIS